MSSESFEACARPLIEASDKAGLIALIRPRIEQGCAREIESLYLGVLLLQAPSPDYEAASKTFRSLLSTGLALQAAVWDAYRHASLQPHGARAFDRVLRHSPNAVAAHMRCLVAISDGDFRLAVAENRKSRTLCPFPFNLIEALRHDDDLGPAARNTLWKMTASLAISICAESDPPVGTVGDALDRQWDRIILGNRMTSAIWSELSEEVGSAC